MGTILGVVVGYALGTRAGEQGWTDLEDAWKVIRTSEEVRDLVVGGFAMARRLLARGSGVFSELVAGTDDGAGLRRVA